MHNDICLSMCDVNHSDRHLTEFVAAQVDKGRVHNSLRGLRLGALSEPCLSTAHYAMRMSAVMLNLLAMPCVGYRRGYAPACEAGNHTIPDSQPFLLNRSCV